MKTYYLTMVLFCGFCSALSAQVPARTLRTPARIPTNVTSVTSFFHQLGGGKIRAELPAVVSKRVEQIVYQRPLESLQLEAKAYGMSDENISKCSRQELEEWLDSYKSWVNSTSHFDIRNYLHKWENYPVPFHSDVKEVRVLLVHDNYVSLYNIEYAAPDPRVKITYAPNAFVAKMLLAQNTYDIILAGLTLGENQTAFDIADIAQNKGANIPVVLYSSLDISPDILFRHHIVGQISIPTNKTEASQLINYISHMSATGHAYH